MMEPYTVSQLITGLGLILEPKRTAPVIAPTGDNGDLPHGHQDALKVATRLRSAGLTGDRLLQVTYEETERTFREPMPRDHLERICGWAEKNAAAPLSQKVVKEFELDEAQTTVRLLVEQPPDKRRVATFEPQNLGALALVRDQDPSLFVEFKQGAKGYLPELNRALGNRRLQVAQQNNGQGPATIDTILSNLGIPVPKGIAGLVLPPGYVFDKDGTATINFREDPPKRNGITHAYILVTKKLRDLNTGDISLELQHFTPQGWRKLTVARGVAGNSRHVPDLANQDYPVASHNATEVSRYHFEFEAANKHTLPLQKVTSTCGWTEDNGQTSFMWGREHIADMFTEEITFHAADAGDSQVVDGFRSKGTLAGWLEAIKPIRDHARVRLMMNVSLSSPLLQIVDAENYAAESANATSTGKTINLEAAASVWGNPVQNSKDSCLNTWDLTTVGAERTCELASDLPLFLDDTKRAKPGQISPILYSVVSGHGRKRGSVKGLRRTGSWRTVLISTGEGRLATYCEEGGVRARILEITGPPFGADNPDTKKIVDTLRAGVCENYGHAGPAFVRWLIENDSRWPEFKKRYAQIKERYQGQTGAASRLGDMAAIIDLTGELVHEAIAFPWPFRSPFDTLWSALDGGIEDSFEEIHIDVRALGDVISWAHSHEATFHGRFDEEGREPVTGWSGRWDEGADWKFIAFYPHKLREILEHVGYKDHDAVISGWKQRGVLDAPAKNTYTKVVKVKYTPQRLVVLKREALPDYAADSSCPDCDIEAACLAPSNRGNQNDCKHFQPVGIKSQNASPQGELPMDDV